MIASYGSNRMDRRVRILALHSDKQPPVAEVIDNFGTYSTIRTDVRLSKSIGPQVDEYWMVTLYKGENVFLWKLFASDTDADTARIRGTLVAAIAPHNGAALTYDAGAQAWTPGLGHATATSTTRPASPTTGQSILETDTSTWRWWNGTAWANHGVPVGTIAYHTTATAPAGWLKADGTTKSRATYDLLFAVIGTTFNTGGESGTTFRLPSVTAPTSPGIAIIKI